MAEYMEYAALASPARPPDAPKAPSLADTLVAGILHAAAPIARAAEALFRGAATTLPVMILQRTFLD